MQKTPLDEFDRRLLAALQRDAVQSVQTLAEQVGLSPSQCSRRRARLESEGVILGVHARLDAARLGHAVTAFVQVTLARHSPDNARQFRELVARTEPIQQAFSVTGDADYMLRVIVPDLAALAALVNEALLAHASVAHVRSSVALERLKDTHSVPVR